MINQASKWWQVQKRRSLDCCGKEVVFSGFSGSKGEENGTQRQLILPCSVSVVVGLSHDLEKANSVSSP
jgi:hypothetical protein